MLIYAACSGRFELVSLSSVCHRASSNKHTGLLTMTTASDDLHKFIIFIAAWRFFVVVLLGRPFSWMGFARAHSLRKWSRRHYVYTTTIRSVICECDNKWRMLNALEMCRVRKLRWGVSRARKITMTQTAVGALAYTTWFESIVRLALYVSSNCINSCLAGEPAMLKLSITCCRWLHHGRHRRKDAIERRSRARWRKSFPKHSSALPKREIGYGVVGGPRAPCRYNNDRDSALTLVLLSVVDGWISESSGTRGRRRRLRRRPWILFIYYFYDSLYNRCCCGGFPPPPGVSSREGLHTQSLRLFCFAVFVSGESPVAVTGERHLPPWRAGSQLVCVCVCLYNLFQFARLVGWRQMGALPAGLHSGCNDDDDDDESVEKVNNRSRLINIARTARVVW